MTACLLCGQPIRRRQQGRRRRYCSRACQQRAYRWRQEERLWASTTSRPADSAEVAALLSAALRRAGR
jgi:endogenous inhibitor of DNA gyrase (YacG/DUF329 family)